MNISTHLALLPGCDVMLSCDQLPPASATLTDCALKLWDKTNTSFLKLHLICHSSEAEIDAEKQGHL